MERNSATTELNAPTQAEWNQQKALSMGLLVLSLLFLLPGCSLWGKSELKQYREENQRLLGDFRAQRDRAEQLEIEKRALVGRLKDLEGRLATIFNAIQDPAAGQLSSSNPSVPGNSPSGGSYTASPTPQVSPQTPFPPQTPFQPASALDAWQAKEDR